jgi:hypothetical protein
MREFRWIQEIAYLDRGVRSHKISDHLQGPHQATEAAYAVWLSKFEEHVVSICRLAQIICSTDSALCTFLVGKLVLVGVSLCLFRLC